MFVNSPHSQSGAGSFRLRFDLLPLSLTESVYRAVRHRPMWKVDAFWIQPKHGFIPCSEALMHNLAWDVTVFGADNFDGHSYTRFHADRAPVSLRQIRTTSRLYLVRTNSTSAAACSDGHASGSASLRGVIMTHLSTRAATPRSA